ncbi:MAG: ABC-2 type transport system ATP-binding protein [Flavobacteriales bacterium]|jgi:ABC-2 type transport system ATP-binding protein
MSIKVSQVTKYYGEQKALDAVSFELKKGEVVGFLGPNGAGKSTMMKILTSYLPPSEGKAEVGGFDVEEDAMSVKELVGYLPEHNPLYLEMYVREYLNFVASLYKQPLSKVDEMIALTGLQPEQHKQIGDLSKGYRQRVGLAQALIHNPEVLILDEPTTGLDPNQLKEIRALIKEIGKEKTILFSTHIMQEVEALCDRVIIIDSGRIVADKPTAELKSLTNSMQIVTVEFEEDADKNQLATIEGVENVEEINSTTWKLTSSVNKNLRKSVFEFAVKNDLTILQQQQETQDLESIFQELTNNK